MIVVDTNLCAYLWIPGEFTDLAEHAILKDPEWVAPYLWRSEFRNVLTDHIRRGLISLDAAMQLLDQAEAHMQGGEYTVDSKEVVQRAVQSRCSAYDCEFVVLAEQLGVPLVTSDRQVLTAFPSTAVSLSAFVSA